MKEAYDALGLEEGSRFEEVKRAYRYLSKKYHPDLSGRGSARFIRVKEAYESLEGVAARGGEERKRFEPGGDEELFALGEALEGSSDPDERRDAARGLGFTGRRAAWIYLRKALYDADEGVALAAVRSIAHLSIAQAQGEVASLYSRGSARVRAGIVRAAELSQEPLFLPALDSAMLDRDPLAALAARKAARLIRSGPK